MDGPIISNLMVIIFHMIYMKILLLFIVFRDQHSEKNNFSMENWILSIVFLAQNKCVNVYLLFYAL